MSMTLERKLAYGVSLVVIAVVIGGILTVGSPGARRMERLDLQRVNDLYSIAGYVSNEYGKSGAVPATLEGADAQAAGSSYVTSLTDPVTGQPYEYAPQSEAVFSLCATFDRSTLDDATTPQQDRPVMPPMKDSGIDFSRHPAGRHCFETDARLMAPYVSCSLRNPCQEGATCVELPDEPSPVCVPVGYECRAAGCASDVCAMTKSYPAQVRCTDDAQPTPSAAAPNAADDASSCVLLQDRTDGSVGCFGCANGICKDPTPAHVPYEPQGDAGIPYSCYAADTGCELAQ